MFAFELTLHLPYVYLTSFRYVYFKNLAKPSKPEGPLEVSDVHKEGCKLKWKKPKDDGGEPIEGYAVEKFDADSGMWLPVGKTKDPELEVLGLVPGHEYNFRVKAFNKEGESEPLETMAPIIAKDPFSNTFSGEGQRKSYGRTVYSLRVNCVFVFFFFFSAVPSAPRNPEAIDWSPSYVELSWKEPTSDGGAVITGYIIEKRDKYR